MINTLSGNQLLGALVRWENHPKTDDLPLPRGVVRECFSMMLPHAGSTDVFECWALRGLHPNQRWSLQQMTEYKVRVKAYVPDVY